jgi:multicomponent Na+:H+ antiporter subunit E
MLFSIVWRAFHPRMPMTPELIGYPLRLHHGLSQVMLVNTTSSLRGTLSGDLDRPVSKVYVRDGLRDFLLELEALKQRVRHMCARTIDDFPGR